MDYFPGLLFGNPSPIELGFNRIYRLPIGKIAVENLAPNPPIVWQADNSIDGFTSDVISRDSRFHLLFLQ